MSKIFIALGFGLLCSTAFATKIVEKPLIDVVTESDHALIGEVTKVEMIDGAGRNVTDLNQRTGPGYTNTIRLNVAIQRDGVFKTNKSDTPHELKIPLWQGFIDTLGSMQYMQGRSYIFLLSGADYQVVYPLGLELSKRNETTPCGAKRCRPLKKMARPKAFRANLPQGTHRRARCRVLASRVGGHGEPGRSCVATLLCSQPPVDVEPPESI